ncbi:MAG: choice-of-anchor E domain-containing protein [Phycisphaerae bacterium]|nr:choice-of-anchor E domain-containing protein [Phycisphaerae bacterium]
MKRCVTLFALPVVGALVGGITGSARAESVDYSASISLATTNWSDSISIPLFDPNLGSLVSIEFYLSGMVAGNAAFESLDAAQSIVDLSLKAEIKLMRPDASSLVVVLPEVNTSDSVQSFDGSIDFGGDSGRTHNGLTSSMTEAFFSPPPVSDLALFTGNGTINLLVSAAGLSSASGAGNLITFFQTQASADVRVRYNYTTIPLPSVAGMGLSGIACMGLRRRR